MVLRPAALLAIGALIGAGCTESPPSSNATPQSEMVSTQVAQAGPIPVSVATTGAGTLPANETFINIAKAARASVVNISSSRKIKQDTQPFGSPFDVMDTVLLPTDD